MRLRLLRYVLRLALAAVGLALALDALYFARGSLEMFPTREDHEKVRLVTGAGAAVLAALGLGLWRLLRRLSGGAGGQPAGATGRSTRGLTGR